MQDEEALSLNAVRVFVQIARHRSVTQAARNLGITQSSASRHLSVLENYLGEKLLERRGRNTQITNFGRLFAETVSEPLETILFTAQRMRRQNKSTQRRIVVRTSLSTFSYTLLIPHLHDFSNETGGAVVDVVSSQSAPDTTDGFDVLLTRNLPLVEPSDFWDFHEESLVCVGAREHVSGRGKEILYSSPMVTVTSRPDILPAWIRAMDLSTSDVVPGPQYDHHYLALPAITQGKYVLVAPKILVASLIKQGLLGIVAGSEVQSGMKYRAYAVDRSQNPDLARSFCRWLSRLSRTMTTLDQFADGT